MKTNLVKGFIITTFVSLYLVVSVISTIHVIEFFKLSNPSWLAISLAIAFEIGAAASLASLIALDKMNRGLVWLLFITLTAMQMMGNTYYAFINLENYQGWIELFGLVDEEPIYQKRILSIISGAILPLVALGFIKSLVDYVRPSEEIEEAKEVLASPLNEEAKNVWAKVDELKREGKLPVDPTIEELAEEPTALANSGYRERGEMATALADDYSNDEELETASLVDFIENPEFENDTQEAFFGQHIPEVKEAPVVNEAPIAEEINTVEEKQEIGEIADEKKKL